MLHVLQQEYLAWARRLIQSLCALPEPSMRAFALGEQLLGVGALQGVWTIEEIVRATMRRDPAGQAVYDCMNDPQPIMRQLGDERLGDMLSAGIEEGCVGAVQWLRAPGIVAESDGEVLPVIDRLIARALREMSLGDRRALARRAAGHDIALLTCDPDPGVIHNLLRNPKITEAHVLAICARRPTVSAPLEEVLRSPHWMRRYRIKFALARNPYLALRCGLNLLVYLRREDLQDLSLDNALSSMLRLGAQRLLDIELND